MAHENERELLERAANLVGNPGTNISGSTDIACIEWQKDYADFLSTLPEEKEEVLKDWATCSNYKTTCCGLGADGKCPCFSYSVRFNPNNQ